MKLSVDPPNLPSDFKFFIDAYKKIYELEKLKKDTKTGDTNEEILEKRSKMKIHFEAMRKRAQELLPQYSDKSKMGKALAYFVGNYDGLTLFMLHPEVPIDNNASERLLRSPVIGRKTWIGTHSRRGAVAQAILFTICQGCQLVGINPYQYVEQQVATIHRGETPLTPQEFKARSLHKPQ